MKELLVRSATGVVYVALVLGAAFVGELTTALLFLPVCAIAAREMHSLLVTDERDGIGPWTIIAAVVMYLAHVAGYFDARWTTDHVIGSAALLLLISLTLFLRQADQRIGPSLSNLLLAMLVGASFGSIVWFFSYDRWLFVGCMLMLWTNDTGAYLVGRAIGRTKLLLAVSPKKTVEGLIGGVLLTLLVGYVLAQWQPVLSVKGWMLCALVVAISATIGDLFESALKRTKGVKDSGTLLPGHGGILDRFDGFIIAVPAMLLMARLLLAAR